MADLDTSGLRPLDTTGLKPVGGLQKLDTSGLTPLDVSGLTPISPGPEQAQAASATVDDDPMAPLTNATFIGRFGNAVSNLANGATSTAASIPKALAIAAATPAVDTLALFDRIDRGEQLGRFDMSGPTIPIDATWAAERYQKASPEERARMRQQVTAELDPRNSSLYRSAQSFQDAVTIPTNPTYDDEMLAGKIPRGLGSSAAFLVGGLVLGRAGVPGAVGVASLGSAANASSQFEDALSKGANISTAMQAAGQGAIIGTSEAIPISRMLDRLDNATGGTVKRVIVDAIKEGTEEAIQEAASQILNNLSARGLYDPSRDVLEDVGDNAKVGGASGVLMSLLVSLAGGKVRGSASHQQPNQTAGSTGQQEIIPPTGGNGGQGAAAMPQPGITIDGEATEVKPAGQQPNPPGVTTIDGEAMPVAPANVTAEDVASPLPTDMISEGRDEMAAALGELSRPAADQQAGDLDLPAGAVSADSLFGAVEEPISSGPENSLEAAQTQAQEPISSGPAQAAADTGMADVTVPPQSEVTETSKPTAETTAQLSTPEAGQVQAETTAQEQAAPEGAPATAPADETIPVKARRDDGLIFQVSGQPYATAKGAALAARQRVDLRGRDLTPIQIDGGGWALQEKQQPAVVVKPKRRPTVTSKPEDAATFLARLGGIRDDEGHGLRNARNLQQMTQGGMLIRNSGLSMDEAGEALWEAGYFGPMEMTERPSVAQVVNFLDHLGGGRKRERVLPPEVKAGTDLDVTDRRRDDEEAAYREQAIADITAHAQAINLDLSDEEIEAAARLMLTDRLDAADAVGDIIDASAMAYEAQLADKAQEKGNEAAWEVPFDDIARPAHGAREVPARTDAGGTGGSAAQGGERPEGRAASRASEKAVRPSLRQIGTNGRGRPLFEDENGVRSYTESGIRLFEPVQASPDGMIRVDPAGRGRDFSTSDELAAAKPAADAKPRTEKTDQGDQYVMPGATRVQDDGGPKRAKVPQKAADEGLFSTGGAQLAPDLFAAQDGQPKKTATGKDGASDTFTVGGRTFNTKTFGTPSAANAFMEQNPDWSVIGERDGLVHLALSADRGRKTADTTTTTTTKLDRAGPERAMMEATPQPEETDNGNQNPLSAGDDGTGAADVQATSGERADGRASASKGRGSPRAVRSADGGRTEIAKRPARDAVSTGGRGNRSGTDNRLPAGEPAGSVERALVVAEAVKGENYRIEPGSLAEDRGWKQKARDNITAIELVRMIEAEGHVATAEEQAQLARYVGWGGLKNAFPDGDGNFGEGFAEIGAKLQALLSDSEYATARRSIQYAHYTSETIVRAMWDAAGRLGFKGGAVFEPGMGIGNFAGMMPADMAEASRYSGLELDHMTARIAKLLYPRWGVRRDDFTRAPVPKDAFDLVIGNPPFADVVVKSDPLYAKHNFLLHDYFFAKSLDGVRPGGLLMFITSAGTMNKVDPAAREYLADRANLVGAVRLPGDAFERNAGTSVTTDIIVLRKRLPGEDAGDRSWTETVERALPNKDGLMIRGAVNRYFSEHPEMVLGEEGFFDKLYQNRYAVRSRAGVDLAQALRDAMERLPADQMKPWDGGSRADVDFGTSERKEGSYYLAANGNLMQVRGGVGREVPRRGKGIEGGKTAGEIERIQALIPIRDALRAVYAADLNDDAENAQKARKRLNHHYDAFVAKYGPINKADISYRRPTVIQQEAARAEAREEARYQGAIWDEGSFDPTAMIARKATLAEIARARKEAKEAAERAGQPWDEGSFDPADMPDVVIDKRPNIEPFADDPENYRLRAIERYNDATGVASKSEVFSRSIITREVKPQINSVQDAVLHTLNKVGRLDIQMVAEAAGVTEAQAISQLGSSIYQVPGTDGEWQTADEYLSGNVRQKLRVAEAAAERNPAFRRNVEALRAAVPAPIPPAEISANLGMPWVPPAIIEQFSTQALGLRKLKARYTAKLATWEVAGDTGSAAAVNEWGTEDMPAPALIEAALNRKNPKVTRTVIRDGKKASQIDTEATEAAQEKMAAIKARFREWIWDDKIRSDELAAIYNENYNSHVVREHNGDFLTTPGIASGWQWREHQKRAIARIILSGNTYLGHAVGAGKTSVMIGAGMEMRRLGLVNKPMYVVPNHMLGQFATEFYQQYPTARIRVADERAFHTDRRKQFLADVAASDLDAIIITHSAFGMIPVSDTFEAGLIQKELDDYRSLLSQLQGQENRITRSRIEKQIERLEQRLSGNGKRKDEVFTFEEMGVDFLFVDEAHLFRKLDFSTNMSSVKGISPDGSKAAWDLFVKTRYLESIKPGRNLVLASGTPVTNTMAELFTVSRYLQMGELEARGLDKFDAWAGAFGDTVTSLEQDPAGGYKPVTRFAKFVNVPELSAMVRQVMDVVTSKQLGEYVTRPALKGGRRILNIAERSEALADFQTGLASRMEAISKRKGPPKPGDDILLSVINDGRHAAIDMRLVNPDLPNDPGSKLNLMVDNVYRIWSETKRQRFYKPLPGGGGYDLSKPVDIGPATQMIFRNLGISGSRGFSVSSYIVSELVRRGVPKNEIALIDDYDTHVAKLRLFNDMNEGKVRILIGSTQKMATGVNAQRRLYALHNLDPLWYPADDEQRNGRAIRQGNLNPEIEIHDYSTKGTYDSTMWGLMETKARFIQGFFEGDPSLRDMDDLGEASTYEQAKAISTADPRLIELTNLRQELEKAERRRTAYEREQYSVQQRIEYARSDIAWVEKRLPMVDADLAQRKDTKGDLFEARMGRKVFSERIEFGDALLAEIDAMRAAEKERKGVTLAEVGGFTVKADAFKFDQRWNVAVYIVRNGEGQEAEINVSPSARGTVQSIEATLRSFDDDREMLLQRKASAQAHIDEFTPKLGKPFTGGEEIRRLRAAVADLERQLSADSAKDNARQEAEAENSGGEEKASIERPRVTPAFERAAGDIEADLRRRLNRLGLSAKVQLRIVDMVRSLYTGQEIPEASGLYSPMGAVRVIQVSLSATDRMSILNHETIHAMREMGVFLEAEWTTLSRAAKADTARMAEVRRRYDGYGLSEADIIEEAIADMFADWSGGRMQARGFIAKAFQRLREIFEAIGNALRGAGFRTMDAVFRDVDAGTIASRTNQQQANDLVPDPLGMGATVATAEAASREAPAIIRERMAINQGPTAPGRQQMVRGLMMRSLLSQPIDRVLRIPFDIFGGLDATNRWNPSKFLNRQAARILTEAEFNDNGRFGFLNPIMNKARAGLIDRYGLDDAYVARDRQRGLEEGRILREGSELLTSLSRHVDPAEMEILQAVLTGEQVPDARWRAVSEPIRKAIDQLGQEAVALGLLSAEAFDRNRATYLHRTYRAHELDKGGLGGWVERQMSARRRRIIGNQFKGRGLFMEATPGALTRNIPGFAQAQRGMPVKGDRFIVLDRTTLTGQSALPGVGQQQKAKVVDRVYIPEGTPIPAAYAGYENRGVWEVRGQKGGKIVLWRDFTKAERVQMGEIVDARYNIAKTYQLMARDLSTGRFFSDIAKNPAWSKKDTPPEGTWKNAADYGRLWKDLANDQIQWVRVPDTTIPDSDTKRYSALAGMFVRAEIWRDMAEMEALSKPNLWDRILRQWKLNKTARSPVVHMNNVVSNMVLMDMADVTTGDLVAGIRSMLREDADYVDAVEHGAFGNGMVAMEFRRTTLEPLLREIEGQATGGVGYFEDFLRNNATPGVRLVLNKLYLLGRLADRIFRGAAWADKKMLDAYQMEDEVFRMALYMRRRRQGMAPELAAAEALEQFIDYDIRAPWINALRRSILPFISYTYRAVPLVARTVTERPWKVAKYAAIGYAVNALSYLILPGDEDEERRSLRDAEQGNTWFGTERLLRLPFEDAQGNPMFLDTRRFIPAGDVFDLQEDRGAIPLPSWLLFGGPAMMAAELALNKQAFTGQEIVDKDTSDASDTAGAVADYLWKSWMPSAVYIPGSFYWTRAWEAAGGVRDKMTGRPYSLPQALANSVGVKVRPQDVDAGFEIHRRIFAAKERALRDAARDLARDLDRGAITDKKFDKRMNDLMGKLERLNDRRERTFQGRTSGDDGDGGG